MTDCGSGPPAEVSCGWGVRVDLVGRTLPPRIDEPWTEGVVSTGLGEVPRARTRLSLRDRLGTLMMRWGMRRSRCRVPPRLYAVGSPTKESPVFVSAKCKLSFDRLRSALDGRDSWILVLDTKGINVWCAAGKGPSARRRSCTASTSPVSPGSSAIASSSSRSSARPVSRPTRSTICPHAVFRMERKRAALADRGACMECGACARHCGQGAIRVRVGVGYTAGLLAGLAAGTEPTCGGCAEDFATARCS
jgi:ferredoxin-like protein FixX